MRLQKKRVGWGWQTKSSDELDNLPEKEWEKYWGTGDETLKRFKLRYRDRLALWFLRKICRLTWIDIVHIGLYADTCQDLADGTDKLTLFKAKPEGERVEMHTFVPKGQKCK
jgi:hypothetical protein